MAYQALGILELGTEFLSDPALTEFTCLAQRARDVFKSNIPGPACPRRSYTTTQKNQGVGLYRILEPIRVGTWIRGARGGLLSQRRAG